jgi:hypothetical protein
VQTPPETVGALDRVPFDFNIPGEAATYQVAVDSYNFLDGRGK